MLAKELNCFLVTAAHEAHPITTTHGTPTTSTLREPPTTADTTGEPAQNGNYLQK
jgi:hypothetical protein